ncbi:undecaprenyl-diphosphatase [Sediminihabitans luteus]|uniref:Undecaprenyl-diphosphatase n=1 Tax=Sediminihabitans luteus TaxID=1138585 RepID=A0A2M9D1L9_9CELL|nr:phosphatase PAP2 family protein [Sediminihabitans luteus]PJJ77888.1 undecaprenyl-diphosphatase [Sediminihabitans luteus]GII99754.1 phosphatase PAP2 family protein [Sediminihabitans luteus]
MLTRPRRRALLRAGAFALVASVPTLVLAYLVRAEAPGLLDLDVSVVEATTTFTREHPAVETAATVWSEVFEPRYVNLAGAVLALWVWRRHGLATRALWAVGTLLASWGVAVLAKQVVGRARPVVEDALVHAPGFSFPSGHATASATAAVTLTLLVWPVLGPRARVVVPLVAGSVVVLTSLDRLLLGAHFPSDVVAGCLLGATLSTASYLGYVGWNPQHPGDLPEPDHGPTRPAKDS